MTTIEFFKNENSEILEVKCHGHSGFAVHGKDIVCAAISAMVGSCALGLKEVSKLDIVYFSDDKIGKYEINLPKNISEKSMFSAQTLLKTLLVSLLDLEKSYQKNLKVKEYNYVY